MRMKISGDRFHTGKSSCLKNSEKEAECKNLKQGSLTGSKDSGGPMKADSYFSGLGYFPEHEDIADHGLKKFKSHQEELRLIAQVGALDDLHLDILQAFGENITVHSTVQSWNSQLIEPSEERVPCGLPSAAIEILQSCRSRLAMKNGRKISGLFGDSKQQWASSTSLSTNHIIELAAGNFIQSNSATATGIAAISHPYASSLVAFQAENTNDVQLVQDLLSCAEKVGNQQYSFASKLHEKCNKQSSSKTSTIQHLVCCFTEALHDKICKETGRYIGKSKFSLNTTILSPATAALQRKLPVTQVGQLACIQTIMDHVSRSRKVHIIELEIHCGLAMIILLHEFASRSEYPLEHVKITALASTLNSSVEESGARLRSMAESLHLSFSFHTVLLEDIINHQQKPFDLDAEETVVGHAAYALQLIISKPFQLEALIWSIKGTNPHAMIITETESNTCSPSFVNRFVEALFYFGAYFDSMEDCMKNDVANRALAESILFNPAIKNIVAAEGENRNLKTVGINIWRAFFARFGMVEIELSKSALNQANFIRSNMHGL